MSEAKITSEAPYVAAPMLD
jgi:hypothetical protein